MGEILTGVLIGFVAGVAAAWGLVWFSLGRVTDDLERFSEWVANNSELIKDNTDG